MATVKIIDPVTRIEGHLAVDVTIDANKIVDAHCTGTLFRGFETILKGRHPWDAPVITQRICGVCPISHGLAAVTALDNAGGRTAPNNGRILRNLTLAANFIQSHILHFYLLSAVDYVKGPGVAPWVPAFNVDMRVPDSVNAAVLNNLTIAIEARRRAHEMGALIAGRMPSTNTMISGGHTAPITADVITRFRAQLNWLIDFIRNVYIPDVQTIGSVYSDYFSIGKGHGHLLAYGVFDLDNTQNNKLLKMGYVETGKIGPAADVDLNNINEAVTYSWYDNATNNRVPFAGDTLPVYPKTGAYSWLKAPRYQGNPCEAGPLARMWVNGDYQKGISVMDRHVARANEALKVATAMNDWVSQLAIGQPVFDQDRMPTSGEGIGLTEAPRGALGHWVKIANGVISQYQVITPTCWNASPRDDKNVPGPIEMALIGTPIQNPDQPIEVLRVIHSFDPCLSCAVHVMRPGKKPIIVQTHTGLAQE